MKQKAMSAVIREWSDALVAAQPHVPEEAQARLDSATADLLNALASTATDLAVHAPIPNEVRVELEALRIAATTALERLGAVERRQVQRSEVDQDMQRQIDSLSDRTGQLEDRALDAREAGR